ncbi:DUF6531 domain-containing protein [Pseudomonas sp. EA_35y_Pfl2_R5]|uniref:DUF6531 domain-containing protein n=1 Tax=Pseudomonas sp. EA_35y_Pfl2_R5 TaxID=3088690 RepID=UPI0030D87FD2
MSKDMLVAVYRVQSRHPTKPASGSQRNWLFLLLLLPILFYMSSANATTYSWKQSHKPYGPFSSPSQACDAHRDYLQSVSSTSIRFFSPSISPQSEKIFNCLVKKSINGVPAPSTGTVITRSGDSCLPGSTYNPTTGECVEGEKGPPPSLGCAGNPINITNGNKFQVEADHFGSSAFPLDFARTYNSLDGLWRHNYSTYITTEKSINGVTALLVMAHGRESLFTVNGSTSTPISATELGRLSKLANNGWLYIAENSERFSFDAGGRLTQWSNNAGAQQQLVYANGQVTVTDNLGYSMSFTEDLFHQPLTLSAAGLTIKYDYNADNRLSRLTRTRGGQIEHRLFHYEDSRNSALLTGITDERGVRYATWSYDDQGRATSSEHAGGVEHTDVAYNTDGSSTITNELGKKSTYRFVTIDGVKRVSAIEGEALGSCPMSNSTFTYDARGLLKTKTDNKGHLTTYDYNTRGLEVARTEAAGTPQARTITTDWHPTLFLRTKVTEPTRITTYIYDGQGRQLSQSVTQR